MESRFYQLFSILEWETGWETGDALQAKRSLLQFLR
jgi:hypothetical protein